MERYLRQCIGLLLIDKSEPNPCLYRFYTLQLQTTSSYRGPYKEVAEVPTTKRLIGHVLAGLEQDEKGSRLKAIKLESEVVELEADLVD
jgi:hypothetical protein